jgi:hypothetical protein
MIRPGSKTGSAVTLGCSAIPVDLVDQHFSLTLELASGRSRTVDVVSATAPIR